MVSGVPPLLLMNSYKGDKGGYISCPMCSKVYGVRTGTQPDGSPQTIKPSLIPRKNEGSIRIHVV